MTPPTWSLATWLATVSATWFALDPTTPVLVERVGFLLVGAVLAVVPVSLGTFLLWILFQRAESRP